MYIADFMELMAALTLVGFNVQATGVEIDCVLEDVDCTVGLVTEDELIEVALEVEADDIAEVAEIEDALLAEFRITELEELDELETAEIVVLGEMVLEVLETTLLVELDELVPTATELDALPLVIELGAVELEIYDELIMLLADEIGTVELLLTEEV